MAGCYDGSAPPLGNASSRLPTSPRTSMARQESNTMPPPATNSEKEGTIKPPPPYISMGVLLRALVSALWSQDLDDVELFLKDLPREKESREPDGPEEPMLILVSAPRAPDLVFPLVILEGKANLTGKQISVAENQGAVSGACALKMQLRLDELAKRATAETSKDQPPTSSDGLPTPSKDQTPTLH